MFRVYFWLCTPEPFLTALGVPYGMLGNQLWLTYSSIYPIHCSIIQAPVKIICFLYLEGVIELFQWRQDQSCLSDSAKEMLSFHSCHNKLFITRYRAHNPLIILFYYSY